MRNLINKELKLALHPTAPLFLVLAFMLIIPNYPYYVAFFYMTLSIFFICLSGRENNDISYSLLLPVRKRDIVKARFITAAILELAQLTVAVAAAVLNHRLNNTGNDVGMDANIALFGLSFVMFAVFNYIFFVGYYRNVNKVGAPFVKSSAAVFVYIAVVEVSAHICPFMRDKLDTIGEEYLTEKLSVLIAGIVLWVGITLIALKKSIALFEKEDL